MGRLREIFGPPRTAAENGHPANRILPMTAADRRLWDELRRRRESQQEEAPRHG